MVKVDSKRDYYADLDLPSTADTEEIKRQFRLLAKQYHPDRNPGREVEFVPKFQAVQAAHEILSDPVEKTKYDAARARHAAKSATTDPYGFSRSANSKPTTATPQFPFPPPPSARPRRPNFGVRNDRPQTSSGADKFNAFARGAPQTWDRARFDDARAEAARGFPSMRPAQSPQQMPPRPARQAPTAPRPTPSSENAHMPNVPNVPPTTFPGLSRAASTRPGYNPGSAGIDEQATRSAYSYVRGSRPPVSNPHMHASDPHSMHSPPVSSRARPAVSPLRHTRSSDHDMRSDHLGSRPSSRYAGAGGERTDIHGDGIHRSASVRNSPIDPHWDDRGPFGRPSSHFEHLPRHRSASPGMRPSGTYAESSTSSSEDEDEVLHVRPRQKAVPRSRPRPPPPTFHAFADDDPALTGQFPNTNYTRLADESQSKFAASDTKEPTRKPFPNMTTPDIEVPMPNDLHGHGGHSDGPKYAPFPTSFHPWLRKFGFGGTVLNGLPSWAVPSTVFPQPAPERLQKHMRYTSGRERLSSWTPTASTFFQSYSARANSGFSDDQGSPHPQSTFSAAQWQDKVTVNDFRPSDPQMRKSPSKVTRPGSKPVTRGRGMSRGVDPDKSSSVDSSNDVTTNHRGGKSAQEVEDTSTAFVPGKLAPGWAAEVKAATAPAPAKPTGTGHDSDSTADGGKEYVVVEEDAMDVDDTPPTNSIRDPASNGLPSSHVRSPRRQSTNGGVDLRELTQQAPFAPTATGLNGMDDLATHLPFKSRAEAQVDPGGDKAAARLRALNLPKPPKPVIPPATDRLDSANFLQYVDGVTAYMREWNSFNAKMIEHFRSRQDRVCGHMAPNWIDMQGDGPDADDLDDDGGSPKAGYAAYMQWLKDDAQCRAWWDHANDKHLQVMEELGRVRAEAKKTLGPA